MIYPQSRSLEVRPCLRCLIYFPISNELAFLSRNCIMLWSKTGNWKLYFNGKTDSSLIYLFKLDWWPWSASPIHPRVGHLYQKAQEDTKYQTDWSIQCRNCGVWLKKKGYRHISYLFKPLFNGFNIGSQWCYFLELINHTEYPNELIERIQ